MLADVCRPDGARQLVEAHLPALTGGARSIERFEIHSVFPRPDWQVHLPYFVLGAGRDALETEVTGDSPPSRRQIREGGGAPRQAGASAWTAGRIRGRFWLLNPRGWDCCSIRFLSTSSSGRCPRRRTKAARVESSARSTAVKRGGRLRRFFHVESNPDAGCRVDGANCSTRLSWPTGDAGRPLERSCAANILSHSSGGCGRSTKSSPSTATRP